MKILLDGCRCQDLINAWRVSLEAKLTCRWPRGWVLAKMAAAFLKLEPAKVIKFVRDLLRSLGRAPLAPGFSVEFLPGGQNFPAKSRLFASLLLGLPFGFPGASFRSRSFKSRRRAMRTGSSGMSDLPVRSLSVPPAGAASGSSIHLQDVSRRGGRGHVSRTTAPLQLSVASSR